VTTVRFELTHLAIPECYLSTQARNC